MHKPEVHYTENAHDTQATIMARELFIALLKKVELIRGS
jgi:hypothetical protein